MRTFTVGFIIALGVLLPAATLAIEYATALSGMEYFDPIPTIWHMLIVASVPILNGLVLFFCLRQSKAPPPLCGVLSATCLFIAFWYSLPYLPLTPFAVPAILLYGIGLLPLSPLFSCLSAYLLRRGLRGRGLVSRSGRVPGLLQGFAISVSLLLLLELRPALTNIGVAMASSENPATIDRGITLLRMAGDDDLLRASCFGRQGRMMDPLSLLFQLSRGVTFSTEKIRNIYFRVTGKSFNSGEPIRRLRREPFFSWFAFDAHRGTRTVGSRIDGLALASSSLAGSIDAEGALGYTEWTLLFSNDSAAQQEARSHIALPPGGVVSRLTLWINGEEHEAVFAGRAKTEEAYRRVVTQQRDPVLVTTEGPGRILLQLFPVPPNGGKMKVRIGITAPLQFDPAGRPMYTLPAFRDRNFELRAGFSHDLWVDSKQGPADSSGLTASRDGTGTFSVRGQILDEELAKRSITFQPAVAALSLTDDLEPGSSIVQHLDRVPAPAFQRVVAVIDGSAAVEAERPSIEDALAAVAGKADLLIILASDRFVNGVSEPRFIAANSKSFREEVRDTLESIAYVGGQDDVPALSNAMDRAAEADHSAILWWHGPQLLDSPAIEALLQRLSRLSSLAPIYDFEVGDGENTILPWLERLEVLRRTPGQQTARQAFIESLISGSPRLILQRTKQPSGAITGTTHRTSAHLARLWAADEVQRLLLSKTPHGTAEATDLASRYGIVTAVTGAVVLETQQQYQSGGLTPPKALDLQRVPTIPEPETYLMMLIAALFGAFTLKFRRLQTYGSVRS